jgi:hypothetical protein
MSLPRKPAQAETDMEIAGQPIPEYHPAADESNPEIRHILRRTETAFHVLTSICILIGALILLKLLCTR